MFTELTGCTDLTRFAELMELTDLTVHGVDKLKI